MQLRRTLSVPGCGSRFFSRLNEGGFRIMKDCLDLTVPQAFKTWTVGETIIGVEGLLLALLGFHLVK